jgi:ornithine cyclodeaminase/alanine dehydrogenase-like protein (mu-crystallin family)
MTLAGSILQPCQGLHRATAERFFRVFVDAGTDPLTRRTIRLKSRVKTEQQARIELGRLLKEASEGRTPESGATVAKLMDEYAAMSL